MRRRRRGTEKVGRACASLQKSVSFTRGFFTTYKSFGENTRACGICWGGDGRMHYKMCQVCLLSFIMFAIKIYFILSYSGLSQFYLFFSLLNIILFKFKLFLYFNIQEIKLFTVFIMY